MKGEEMDFCEIQQNLAWVIVTMASKEPGLLHYPILQTRLLLGVNAGMGRWIDPQWRMFSAQRPAWTPRPTR